MEEIVDLYAFTDENIDNIISELQKLKEGKRKYAGFSGVSNVLIVKPETYSLLVAEDLTALSEKVDTEEDLPFSKYTGIFLADTEVYP